MAADPLSQAMDRLYAGALEDFLPRRKQLAAELRTAGDAAGAQQLAAAAKPTRTAWALNQIARAHPELLGAMLQAREQAAAPSDGDADRLRQATRDYRERVGDVVRAARDLLAEGGVELNTTQARRMAETLQAACASEGEARARLLAGTLTHDVDVEDPFAGLVAGEGKAAGAPAAETQTSGTRARARARDDEALQGQHRREREQREERERALRAARARVAELESAARQAQTHARMTEAAAGRAVREAERAKEAAAEVEAQLTAARADVERAERSGESKGAGKTAGA